MIEARRFSLFEIFIVILLLAMVALIDAPGFLRAREEVKLSRLVDCLEQMRTQLDLYRVEHNDSLPPYDTFADFETAMTTKVSQKGPYIDKVPTNPFNGFQRVRFNGTPAGSGIAGWRLDTKTGLFQADNGTTFAQL
ncbi:type II secretion system protein [Planctomycetota bacterium]